MCSSSWPSAGSRTSWNYDLTSYEAKRLLNLVEEPSAFEQSSVVSESKFTVVSEVTWKSSHPAQLESTTLSRANSDLSMYTPVRRRSIIQTPGVATRRESVSGRGKPNYRHSHPPTPSLSRQASFESNSSRVLSMPPRITDPESGPRVVTPVDGDYKTIGAFKLGSLRITNGAVSPVPSAEFDRETSTDSSKPVASPKNLDYFSSTQKLAASLDESPPGRAARGPDLIAPKPVAPLVSPITTSFGSIGVASRSDRRREPSSAGAELGAEYLAELSVSPLSVEERPSLQTTSKQTAVEDQLFEDEGQLEFSSAEVLDVRRDPSAKPDSDSLRASTTTQSDRSFSRSDSGFISSPTSDASHKPLSKADSGYSSNVSLRSLRSSSKPAVPEKDYAPSIAEHSVKSPRADSFYLELSLPSPTIVAPELMAAPAPPDRKAPPPPPKDLPPRSPAPRTWSLSSMSAWESTPINSPGLNIPGSPNTVKRKPVPSPINSHYSRESTSWLKSAGTTPRSPLSPLSPVSVKSDGSGSALSIGSGSQRPGKLQRLLSLNNHTKGPPTVHATHVEEKADIPSVPQHIEEKLREHTGLFPLSTKRLALKAQRSKDTLKTIFSVGSLEIHSLDSHVSDSDDDAQAEGKDHHRKHGFLSQALRKPIVRKPVPVRKETDSKKKAKDEAAPENILEVEAELTTYSSINNSLGNNPYDAAFMAMRDERDKYFAPTGRTMSMTAQLERSLEMRMAVTKAYSTTTETPVLSPGLPSPNFPEMFPAKKTKTPPPVSMRTQRRPRSLRVPPPLRPQSTPPVRPSLSRQDSDDSIQSYLSYQKLLDDDDDATSMKSPPAIPPMHPRRSIMMLQQQDVRSPRSARPPTQDRQSSSGPRRNSFDQSRSNSLSSQSFVGPHYPGPTQPHMQNVPGPRAAPPLRHRASHDGFSNQTRSWPGQQQLPHGYAKPSSDPWVSPQQSYANQPYAPPPYVPRGHYRNRSLGNRQVYPGQPPYRILHSYNSPAYRGVPIWG